MAGPIVLAVASAACFLALAHEAITTPHRVFLRVTTVLAVVAFGMLLIAPAAGAAFLGPLVLSRRFATAVPPTVPGLLERYRAGDRTAD